MAGAAGEARLLVLQPRPLRDPRRRCTSPPGGRGKVLPRRPFRRSPALQNCPGCETEGRVQRWTAGCGERNACTEAAVAGGHSLSAGGAGRADRNHRDLPRSEQPARCAVLFLGGYAFADRHHRGSAGWRARLRAGDVLTAPPALVAALVSELFALRQAWLHGAMGAAIGGGAFVFAGPLLLLGEIDGTDWADLAIVSAGGLAGGLVYWLVAGRRSGFQRPVRVAAAAG